MFNENNHSNLLKEAFFAPDSGDAMLESNEGRGNSAPGVRKKALSDAIFEAVQNKAKLDERGMVAAALFQWAQGANPTFDDLDGLALSEAGIDDDEEDDDITDEQVDEYNRYLGMLADAAVSLGADQADVTALIDDGDDDAAINVADAITANNDDEDEAVAVYGVSGGDDAMLEANIKVVRNGEIKLKKKRPRPLRRTAAQKAALKKARVKAHTASANLSRRKSLKVRRKRGL